MRPDLFEGAEAFDEGLALARVVGADAVEQYQRANGRGEDEDKQSSEARVKNESWTWLDDSPSLCEAPAIDKYCLDRMV